MQITLGPDDADDAQALIDAVMEHHSDLLAREVTHYGDLRCEVMRQSDRDVGALVEAVFILAGDAYIPPDNCKIVGPNRKRSLELASLLEEHGFLSWFDDDDKALFRSIIDEQATGIVCGHSGRSPRTRV